MQPVTRWVFPYPFLGGTTTNLAPLHFPETAPAVLRFSCNGSVQESIERIAELLVSDLKKGHHYKAIRHFLMLKGRGAHLASTTEFRCQQLLIDCPMARRKRIEGDVQRWLDMLVPSQPPH